MFTAEWFTALGTVTVINLMLSADNAVAIGLAAGGLEAKMRRRAISIGIIIATVLRIGLALIVFELLSVVGLTLAGGLLLLWVCWKMWRDIRSQEAEARVMKGEAAVLGAKDADPSLPGPQPKTFKQALIAIIIADVSMALDNVLAVAGASAEHIWVMVGGLALSIVLMAVAANLLAALMERYHWLGYVGLVIVLYVALDMIWRGGGEVAHAVAAQGLI